VSAGGPPFVLVTGNPGKLAEARRIIRATGSSGATGSTASDAGADLEAVEVDLPEIQSLDLAEILHAKADEAWRRVGRPLVVEEAGLGLAAMNGFPGPLVKWMLDAVGAEGIARAAASLGDTAAVACCALLWTDGERRIVACGETAGRLVLPPRGGNGFGWDPVFLPDVGADGETRTFGELAGAEKDAVSHRGRAWRALLAKLAETA
jgi:non-canonical purine NTP pyrophosphatase (RdgB/HAM1 family)